MAADILLYKAELVPVGIDQEPHIEVTREIARKFNSMFGDTFPEPKRFATAGEYIPSLLGEGKMSKSVEGSYISLTDDLETIKRRLAAAPTDSGKTGGEVPKTGGVAHLFTLLKLFSLELYEKYAKDYQEGKIRYSDMKSDLAQLIFNELQPFQKKRKEFENNPQLVDAILDEHTHQLRRMAQSTIQEVKQKMGFL
ncbi:MAG: hypothetical protein KatS3mg089_0047 [Patescibacteria group bacterium]|nr:MAG: hypothetical protein KatS3mg089_0047 [Patescibacteria group bacterium]